MKDKLLDQWEKIILVVAISFTAWCWSAGGSVSDEVESIIEEGKQILEASQNGTSSEAELPKKHIPKINDLVLSYLEESTDGIYFIPTSPVAGFEELDKVKLSESETKTITLRFKDSQIKKVFKGNLQSDDVTVKLQDESIVEMEIVNGNQIKLTGLKFGTTELSIRNNTLNGATLPIEVEQSIYLKAWYPDTSLQAEFDEEDLNLISLTWQGGLFSHPELGQVANYTLERQDLSGDLDPEKTPWVAIETWGQDECPFTYEDNNVFPSGSYRYRMSITFNVEQNYARNKTYEKNPDFPFNDPKGIVINKNETYPYQPTQLIKIKKGIELLGFRGVSDKGTILDKGKNTIAQVAFKKWHNGYWVAVIASLDRLSTKYLFKIPRNAIKDGLLPLVGKQVKRFKDPTQMGNEKITLDFFTEYSIFNIDVHEAGEELIYADLIPEKEKKRISDDGKHYNKDTRSFWIIRNDDPYFTDPNVQLPKTRMILHSNPGLKTTVDDINNKAKQDLKQKIEEQRRAEEEAQQEAEEEDEEGDTDSGDEVDNDSLGDSTNPNLNSPGVKRLDGTSPVTPK